MRDSNRCFSFDLQNADETESTNLYLQSALEFLQSAAVLESVQTESTTNKSMEVYRDTAGLCEYVTRLHAAVTSLGHFSLGSLPCTLRLSSHFPSFRIQITNLLCCHACLVAGIVVLSINDVGTLELQHLLTHVHLWLVRGS